MAKTIKTIKFSLLVFIIFIITLKTYSQKPNYTISGYITDKHTGEELIGANIYVKNLKTGTSANTYGFYSLNLPKNTYTLIVSFIGYKPIDTTITLNKPIELNFSLSTSAILKKEIVVKAEKADENIENTKMGSIKLPIEQIKNLPAFMGEVDLIKTIQLLPGVQSGGEGNSGFYVRGGGPDQNLILLDEAIVYNAAHLFGFFSVFNSDAIKNVELIKGGMPANYGGRLSSVLDIAMKDGNLKKTTIEGGLGLISSRLTIQGPIKKDTCSYIVSARRTYVDVLMQPFIKKDSPFKGSGYFFYDINAKINYKFSNKNRLFISSYFGRDVFRFVQKESDFDVKIPWGNITTSARWNHLFSNKLFLNASFIYSNYDFKFEAYQKQFSLELFSGIKDLTSKLDFQYMPNVLHTVKFGAQHIYHTFIPSNVTGKSADVEFDTGEITKLYAHESAAYISDEWKISPKIKITAGLRFSNFMHIGPFNRYIKNNFGDITDTIEYKKGKYITDYSRLEPRFSMRFKVNTKSSIKAAYTQNYQYVHLAAISSGTMPTDIWFPSTKIVKPQFSEQYAIGYFRNFFDNKYETSVEVYYKNMQNMIAYKDGALPTDDVKDNADNNFTFGNGWAYGLELFVKKQQGDFTGWIGYTLAYAWRKFPELNNGEPFFAKYDRRHDVSITATYQLSEKWTFSAVWIYGTGNAITLPVSRYVIEGEIINEYGAHNGFRMPAYHRADISATYTPKNKNKNRRLKNSWNFSIYNVYNRYNPYFIYFDQTGDIMNGTLDVSAKQVSLFPILPSITWNFKF